MCVKRVQYINSGLFSSSSHIKGYLIFFVLEKSICLTNLANERSRKKNDVGLVSFFNAFCLLNARARMCVCARACHFLFLLNTLHLLYIIIVYCLFIYLFNKFSIVQLYSMKHKLHPMREFSSHSDTLYSIASLMFCFCE